MFDFTVVTQWFDNLLRQTCGLGDFWTILIECVVVGLIVLTLYALIAMFMIYFERKVCAFFQCRLGPMRVGPWGSVQVVADVLKMLIKEIFGVDRSDKLLYALAPFLTIIASVGTFSFLPWNKGAAVLDFNVGVFMVSAISSIGILGIILSGWGSNNKYSVISAMRGAVQMISYEMSLGSRLVHGHGSGALRHYAAQWHHRGADRSLEMADHSGSHSCYRRFHRVPDRR